MGYINTDQCDCCKEVWNRTNLHHIPLQSKTLIMCDDCLLEFNHCFVNVHKIDNAIEEIETIRNNYEKINNPWGDRWEYTNPYDKVLQILERNIGETK